MEQRTGSKLGKEYVKALYCYPAYLISMQSSSCKMLSWMNHKLESRLPGEISTISEKLYHSNGTKQRRTKEPLDEGEKEEWISCLKTQHSKNKDHGIQSHHLIANSWRKQWKQWQTYNKVCHCFYFFPVCLPLSDGTGCHDLSFLKDEF